MSRMTFPTRAAVLLTVTAALALSNASCAKRDDRKPVFPVSGQVFYMGKPAHAATVTFHSLEDPTPPWPHAYTDGEGRFVLNTYGGGDGAPAGRYAVTVIWRLPIGPKDPTADSPILGPNLLPEPYSNPKTSGLSAEVGAGPNELAPFQLRKR